MASSYNMKYFIALPWRQREGKAQVAVGLQGWGLGLRV